jgi:ABC-2 type transport system ATP-binding protein
MILECPNCLVPSALMQDAIIKIEGLVKRYGDVVALAGLDLSVPKGSILGLLGPNGAGKTTAIRILTTLLDADEGQVEVAGVDVREQPELARSRIGLSGQSAAVDEYLTGFENLDMVGRLYHMGKTQSKARANQLLEQFDLVEAAHRPTKTYSGGMRRRLDLAAALVADPEVLFLDEPTTGLDPRSRNLLWDTIVDLARQGSTVLLTTQYMEEADRLADDIVVIDKGKKIAQGSADALKRQVGGERIEVVLESADDLISARELLSKICMGDVQVDDQAKRLTAAVAGLDPLREVLNELQNFNLPVVDIGMRRPTLDDVFLTLTGHAADGDESQQTEGESR